MFRSQNIPTCMATIPPNMTNMVILYGLNFNCVMLGGIAGILSNCVTTLLSLASIHLVTSTTISITMAILVLTWLYRQKFSLLMWCAVSGNATFMKIMLRFSNVNDCNAYGKTALHFAVLRAQTQSRFNIVHVLIKNGADLNKQDSNGKTALMYAVEKEYLNTAKLLIQAKAAINLQDENGETVLMKSAKLGHKDLVDVVIRQNQWRLNIVPPQNISKPKGAIVTQNEWKLTVASSLNSAVPNTVTENIGVAVTQNEWTFEIKSQDIIERKGAVVVQGTSRGKLQKRLPTEHKIDLTAQIINAAEGVCVSQGTATTGTLKKELKGSTTRIVIETAEGVTFDANTDITITSEGNNYLISAANITCVSSASTKVLISAVHGVTFNATTDVRIGTATVIQAGDIQYANPKPSVTGRLKTIKNNKDGSTKFIVLTTNAGIDFDSDAGTWIGNKIVPIVKCESSHSAAGTLIQKILDTDGLTEAVIVAIAKRTPGQWSCRACTSENEATSTECFMCYSPKPEPKKEVNKKEDGKIKFVRDMDVVIGSHPGNTIIAHGNVAAANKTSADLKDINGKTALMHVILHGKDEKSIKSIVETLIYDETNKGDPNIKDNQGNTALMYAVQKNYREVVGVLIKENKGKKYDEFKADINLTNKKNQSGIGMAIKKGSSHSEMVTLLIDAGADV